MKTYKTISFVRFDQQKGGRGHEGQVGKRSRDVQRKDPNPAFDSNHRLHWSAAARAKPRTHWHLCLTIGTRLCFSHRGHHIKTGPPRQTTSSSKPIEHCRCAARRIVIRAALSSSRMTASNLKLILWKRNRSDGNIAPWISLRSRRMILLPAVFADAVNLEGMTSGEVMILAPNLLLDVSHLLRKELHRTAALRANHVMVAAAVVLMLEPRNPIVKRYFAGQTAFRQ